MIRWLFSQSSNCRLSRASLGLFPRTLWRGISAASSAVIVAGAATMSFAQTPPPPAPPSQPRVTIGFVEIEGDPRHEPIRGYERLILKTREHPFAGAQVGIDEAKALTRVLKIDFALERITVKSADEVAPAVAAGARDAGIHFFIIDAPAEAFKPLAAAVRGPRRAAVQRHRARGLRCAATSARARSCIPIPSLAMSMDALVQYLVSRKWRDFLVLQGPLPADAAMTKAFEALGARNSARASWRTSSSSSAPIRASASRTIRRCSPPAAATTTWSSSPTKRSISPARFPITTVRARPVVGAIDLEPVAWHWTWERNGAPQVNSRFQKLTGGRRMESAGLGGLDRGQDDGAGGAAHALGRLQEAARLHPRRQHLRRRQGSGA